MCRTTSGASSLAVSITTPGESFAGNLYWSFRMRFKLFTTVAGLSMFGASLCARQQTPLPSASEVVAQMMARDADRQQALEGYQGMRKYTLVNEHMGKRAEMVVRVNGDSVGAKHFEVVSE